MVRSFPIFFNILAFKSFLVQCIIFHTKSLYITHILFGYDRLLIYNKTNIHRVEEAFQKKSLSTFMGYVTWMSGAINNAIYPFILWEYLTQITNTISTDDEENSILTGSITEHHYQIIFILVISTILTFIAHRGIDIVSQMSLIICFVSISPFLFMSIIGLKKIELHRLLKLSSPSPINSDNSLFSNESTFLSWYNKAFHMARHAYHGVNWNPFLNNLFWNLTSFDAAASFSTEVHDIKNVYVRGIHWSILVVFLCYLVPLIVSLGAVESEQNDWTDGYLAQIGEYVYHKKNFLYIL